MSKYREAYEKYEKATRELIEGLQQDLIETRIQMEKLEAAEMELKHKTPVKKEGVQ